MGIDLRQQPVKPGLIRALRERNQRVLGVRGAQQQPATPDHPPPAGDRADPVAVAIESHAKIERLGDIQRFQTGQVLLLGGIRMMVRKHPI